MEEGVREVRLRKNRFSREDGCAAPARLRGLLRLLGAPLLDFLDLLHKIIRLFLQGVAFCRALHHIGLAAVEQVEIGHSIVVLRPEGDGLLQVVDALVDDGSVLAGILRANRRWKRIIVPNLFFNILFVVLDAHFAVGAVSQGPVDYANPIIGLWILGLQLDVALVVGLGLFKFLGVEGLAPHLEEDGADTINGRNIVGILFENFLELRDRLFATREVFLGGAPGIYKLA